MPKETSLLLDEQPLVILPQLAELIGLNEAIILQQIHYWLKLNEKAERNFHEGYYWTFNSYRQWKAQFPFWSQRTIQRAISNLEDKGLVVSGEFNRMKGDRSKWYRIDYSCLKMSKPSSQNDQMGMDKMARPSGQNGTTNTRDYLKEYPTENIHKEKYGEFQNVFLAIEEFDKLKDRFNSRLPDMIENMSAAIASKGYKYKSHYAALLAWARKDETKKPLRTEGMEVL